MDTDTLQGRLEFLRQAEKLKDVLRSARSSGGRQESTAEHTWRLCLMAMMLEEGLTGLDFVRVLKLCIIHDLGEAIHGDVPAIEQAPGANKGAQERQDLLTLAGSLDAPARTQLLALWDDYENASSAEARAVKAMDKLETLLQHNQGANGPDFDYAFNLDYGRKYTDALPLLRELRRLVDVDTLARLREQAAARSAPPPRPLPDGDVT
ncbi:HD domain-containing protein [Achromobacter sp. NCFB-sbj8-Ac1-l]|uniref:HD domain-containing protein n=1 Tax=unclassified Achromobacter TaxID=2626865 RepID=UPI004046DF40